MKISKNTFSKFAIVCAIGVLLECFVFNFNFIKSRWNTSKNYNVEYGISDITKVNWTEKDRKMVSEADPQLIIEDVDTEVDNIEISYNIDTEIENIVIFYTNQDSTQFDETHMRIAADLNPSGTKISIKSYVKDLRIDLGDIEGIALEKISIIINPVKFDFSISRFVAMILIYLGTVMLFKLQDGMDYGLEENEGDKVE